MSQLIAAAEGGSTSPGLVVLAIIWAILVIVGWWKIFEKAGEAGWKAIIPFYNIYTMLRIVGQPGWLLIAFFIPLVNVVVWVILMGNLAKSFGKGIGFVLGLIFLNPLFAIILGFGKATYAGPTAQQNNRF